MGKILVCDNEKDVLKLVKEILEPEGHKVITVSSGEECIEKAKDSKPDFIFLDIMMPHMDGWETLEELKKNKETEHIPVSMLTAKHLTVETFNPKKMEDLVAYTHKPFDIITLLDTIDKYV